jgi:hypothetical protein
MPESCRDRPTKAHEQVFLLAKQANYFYDNVAIMEANSPDYAQMPTNGAGQRTNLKLADERNDYDSTLARGARKFNGNGRNRRSVWTLGPESFPGSHFAVMPTKLVEPCILAGTSAHGCCAKCGAPWERVVEREAGNYEQRKSNGVGGPYNLKPELQRGKGHIDASSNGVTLGWQPTCTCHCADVAPCTVLDCFSGSGTVVAIALKHGRRGVGIDLNESYIEMAHDRIRRTQPLLLAAG